MFVGANYIKIWLKFVMLSDDVSYYELWYNDSEQTVSKYYVK